MPAGANLMGLVSRLACSPEFDQQKFQALLSAAERERAYQAERDFNVAMSEAQSEIAPIAADASNPQTRSKYATYLALDRVLRPIYIRHGFSVSYDTADATDATVKVLAYVSHKAGHSRTYAVTIPCDGKGARGGDVMSKTHAMGAAMSYGQRYLSKLIWNMTVGPDDDGNSASISDADFEDLFRLIKLTGTDVDKLCEHYGVNGIPALTKKQFTEAVDHLRRKAGSKGAAAPGFLQ